MDQINKLIPLWKQLYYKWKSLRTIPLRKKFFVGYDLTGNTYWEFFVERKKGIRPRRLYQPYKPQEFIVDYYENIPVQWLQEFNNLPGSKTNSYIIKSYRKTKP
ncbi:uncharacterized protein OGAPODRAFT_9851 [Ogataea polymorpha]|uniref:uncharacterized protein n=1 Tax=Ogataea polymorpha TaxID=460523 RepID=UPI0007F3F4F5|nr:uncharacterized protein OGAPODRAFT_9851 [Ogataea polymorpha]OBA14317.1 hypothetical protein OGAPODRAFT_9851 [Ogataea polymorpha]